MIKLFSFFSGAGFLDYGFETSGYNVVYANEFHRPFLDAYRFSRERLGIDEPEFGCDSRSVTELLSSSNVDRLQSYVSTARSDGSMIGFIGGPPCPDFSVGGKNKGASGENGRLSSTYVELITRHRPNFFLFENVKGLWKTRKHREFYDSLTKLLGSSGYNLSERLINSIEFGVPQDRERIILLGFLDFKTRDENNASTFPWEGYTSYSAKEVFGRKWIEKSEFEEDSVVPCPTGIPKKLTVEYWFSKNSVISHENADHMFQPRAGLSRFKTVQEGDVSRKSYKRLHRWRYSPTAAYGNNEVHLHPYKTRRISVAEALAIQSLPKEFSLPENMSLSNMFKTVGNGVPYLAARGLANSIKKFVTDGRSK